MTFSLKFPRRTTQNPKIPPKRSPNPTLISILKFSRRFLKTKFHQKRQNSTQNSKFHPGDPKIPPKPRTPPKRSPNSTMTFSLKFSRRFLKTKFHPKSTQDHPKAQNSTQTPNSIQVTSKFH
ncbi:hypothetical protein DV515_00019809, partial [Chloebia gouldiae]